MNRTHELPQKEKTQNMLIMLILILLASFVKFIVITSKDLIFIIREKHTKMSELVHAQQFHT
jgi:hypothetical protein